MSKILIWKKPIPGTDIDLFGKTDYQTFYETLVKIHGHASGNWGNKVWFQAIVSIIDTPENELMFRTNETADVINDKYDMIVYPMANFFGKQFCSDTNNLVKEFSGIKIPVYIIACGAQAEDYDHLDDLVLNIGDSAKRFIDTVYATGGEFALRGFFTKEFFDLLGYHTPTVTGCPSLYQNGPDLQINKENALDCIQPVLNGRISNFEKILKDVPKSVFLAQDEFIGELYNKDYFSSTGLKKDILFTYYHSIDQAELLGQGRIKMIADTRDWLFYLKNNGFNFSYGTKIHGSIMPILAGIPAMMLHIDSRTQEMAEYFDIPTLPFQPNRKYNVEDLKSAYSDTDYTSFNMRFRDRYYAFERFLQSHKIVTRINTTNKFFEDGKMLSFGKVEFNRKLFVDYANKLKREKLILFASDLAMRIKNKNMS